METTVERVRDVGPATVAIDLATPADFDAFPGQFVRLVGPDDAGFYTLSSPAIGAQFEITVGLDDSTEPGFADWLADRTPGDTVTIEGPFGDVFYDKGPRPVVVAGGPGIGPAVGIGERAVDQGTTPAIVYEATHPAHENRLASLARSGSTVTIVEQVSEAALATAHTEGTGDVFVFGFDGFVHRATDALDAAGVDPESVRIENFG